MKNLWCKHHFDFEQALRTIAATRFGEAKVYLAELFLPKANGPLAQIWKYSGKCPSPCVPCLHARFQLCEMFGVRHASILQRCLDNPIKSFPS